MTTRMNSAPQVRVRVDEWATVQGPATAIRDEVFVREQGVPSNLEHDPADHENLHALALIDDEAVGTARLKPDGHIGRMAVRAAHRGRGIGAAMLAALMAAARARGMTEVVLNAQVSAVEFYRRQGFVEVGNRFIEAGIDHQTMQRRL